MQLFADILKGTTWFGVAIVADFVTYYYGIITITWKSHEGKYDAKMNKKEVFIHSWFHAERLTNTERKEEERNIKGEQNFCSQKKEF